MTVVTNTGPLIVLAKIDKLNLLPQMFTDIAIPPAVHRELLAKSGIEAHKLDEALTQFIEITAEPELLPTVQVVTGRLDIGEQ